MQEHGHRTKGVPGGPSVSRIRPTERGGENDPLERYDDIDQAVVDRNPPVFSTLCGLDDAFGKSGKTGPDFERLGYAARSGYGRSAAA